MIPYYYHIFYTPVYIPADDKGTSLTGPEFVGLISFIVWFSAVLYVALIIPLDIQDRVFSDNKQDIKRHTIELIVLVAIGVITLAAAIIYYD